MDSIIQYKNSLTYRDEKVQSKINYENNQSIVKHTIENINEIKNSRKIMNKEKELQSNIF